MHSTKIKQQAKVLRAQGASLSEIAEQLAVSKSTVSLWVRDVRLSEQFQARLSEKQSAARKQSAKKMKELQNEKEKNEAFEIESSLKSAKFTKTHLKLLCAFLYWGEGGKTEKYVAFTNSDPLMIATFLQLLRTCFNLDEAKLRALVHIHSYHDEEKILNFWSKTTSIPRSQFTKTYRKKNTGVVKNMEYRGTLRVRYYDAKIAREIKYLYNSVAEIIKGM